MIGVSPKYGIRGRAVWLVGATSGRISNILSIPRRCGHYHSARVRFELIESFCMPVPYPCQWCMGIEP